MGIFDWAEDLGDAIKGAFNAMGEAAFAHAGAVAFVAAAEAIKLANRNRDARKLDSARRDQLRGQYGSLVDDVDFIFGASLVEFKVAGKRIGTNPAAQTFGEQIYVQASSAPADSGQLRLIAHELVHARQYRKAGNLFEFGVEYFREYYRAGFKYAGNNLEEEADRWADCFMLKIGSAVQHDVTWKTGSAEWSAGWTNFTPFLVGGETYLLGYKTASGTLRLDRLLAGGAGIDVVRRDDWGSGWTSFVPFALGGEPHVLVYKKSSGAVKLIKIRPPAEWIGDSSAPWYDELFRSEWQEGWTSFAPFSLGNEVHWLVYNRSSGAVRIDRVLPGGQGIEVRWRSTWGKGWSSFLPFLYLGESGQLEPHQLVYNDATGAVRVDRMKSDAQGVDGVWRDDWSSGWTNFVPLSANGRSYLSYKGPTFLGPTPVNGSGRMQVSDIQKYQVNGADRWTSPSWCAHRTGGLDVLVSFPLNNVWHTLTYDSATGDARIDSWMVPMAGVSPLTDYSAQTSPVPAGR
jgi:hypothetical protein